MSSITSLVIHSEDIGRKETRALINKTIADDALKNKASCLLHSTSFGIKHLLKRKLGL